MANTRAKKAAKKTTEPSIDTAIVAAPKKAMTENTAEVLVKNRTPQKLVLTLPNGSITLLPYEEKLYNIGAEKVEEVFGYWIEKNIVNIKNP